MTSQARAPLTKTARQARIVALLEQKRVRSQVELAELLAGDGVQVNRRQVWLGHATVYVYHGVPFKRTADYRRAEAAAQARRECFRAATFRESSARSGAGTT